MRLDTLTLEDLNAALRERPAHQRRPEELTSLVERIDGREAQRDVRTAELETMTRIVGTRVEALIQDFAASFVFLRPAADGLILRRFERLARPAPHRVFVRLATMESLSAGRFIMLRPSEFFQLVNPGGRAVPLFELRAGPADEVRIYCAKSGRIERRPVKEPLARAA